MHLKLEELDTAPDHPFNVDETGRTSIRRKVDQERTLAVFEKALNTMHLGVTITDTSGRIIFTNDALTRMHGYRAGELIGQDVKVLASAPPEAGDSGRWGGPSKRSDRTAVNPAGPYGIDRIRENANLRKDGSVLPVSFYSDLIEDSFGTPIGIVTTWEDITDRKEAEAHLLHDSLHDRLTKLPNQAHFLDRLNLALARARRDHSALYAVLFLDVDRFKMINDSAGHMVGDQLLVAIAARLSGCFRANDTFARFGGDEFTVLLDDHESPEEALHVAERITKAMEPPFAIDGQDVLVSVSIGITMVSSKYERAEDVLRDADTAMYRAKERGRGGIQVFDLGMHERAVSVLRLECDLRRAVSQSDFVLQFQPIIALEEGRISGFEALIRWNHPTRGLLFPDSFVPVAEESGLVIPMDRWVLGAACARLEIWNRGVSRNGRSLPSADPVSLAVNLSAQQFLEPGLVDEVRRILDATSIDPSWLHIEITETAVMKEPEVAADTVARIRALGVKIHIDDFGTGQSSLSHLHRFAVDALKIDRSFTARIESHKEGLEIVRAIVNLGRNLGVDVITEGIESEEQYRTLLDLGCRFGQGYWLCQPLDADVTDDIILSRSLTPYLARQARSFRTN